MVVWVILRYSQLQAFQLTATLLQPCKLEHVFLRLTTQGGDHTEACFGVSKLWLCCFLTMLSVLTKMWDCMAGHIYL